MFESLCRCPPAFLLGPDRESELQPTRASQHRGRGVEALPRICNGRTSLCSSLSSFPSAEPPFPSPGWPRLWIRLHVRPAPRLSLAIRLPCEPSWPALGKLRDSYSESRAASALTCLVMVTYTPSSSPPPALLAFPSRSGGCLHYGGTEEVGRAAGRRWGRKRRRRPKRASGATMDG